MVPERNLKFCAYGNAAYFPSLKIHRYNITITRKEKESATKFEQFIY